MEAQRVNQTAWKLTQFSKAGRFTCSPFGSMLRGLTFYFQALWPGELTGGVSFWVFVVPTPPYVYRTGRFKSGVPMA